jgi:hypothetical protein
MAQQRREQSWVKASPKVCLLFAKNAAFMLEVLPQMLGAG